VLVQFQTLHSLLQIELIEVVKGHEVSVSPEDIHFVIVDAHALAISRARLFADDVSVTVIVDDLLLQLLVV
jgi:hypothetical protein